MADILEDLHNHDRFEDGSGLEQCPICGRTFGGQAGHLGAVYGPEGERYGAFYGSDPDDGPYYCPRCWDEHGDALYRARSNNKQLTEYA